MTRNLKENESQLEVGDTKKTEVLHIIGSGTIGGAEHFVYQLARYQKFESNEVEAMIHFVRNSGHFYELALRDRLLLQLPQSSSKLSQYYHLLRCMRDFDVLHFHGVYPLHFVLAAISRRRCLYYFHGARALTKTVQTVLKNIVDKKSFRSLPTVKGISRLAKKLWFRFFLSKFVQAAHCPSQHYVGFCIQNYGIPPHRISRLPYGLDFSKLAPASSIQDVRKELGLADELIVGCVSTFRKLKRIDRLLAGFHHYLKANQRTATRLLIVGDGEQRKEIERLIQQLQLSDQVVLTGFRTDIADLLQIMNVFVLPSESESFSIAIAEAMFSGIPVVGFAGSGGAEELLRESPAGIVVESETELGDRISELLSCEKTRKEIGRKLHEYASSRLTIAAFHRSMLHNYRK